MERSSRQKINMEELALNDTFGQIKVMPTCTHIYGTFHPKVAEYIFFSGAHETFSRIDHM